MSDTASLISNDGSASDHSEPSPSNRPTLQSLLHRLGANGGGAALTEANLKRNDSVLANAVRRYEGQENVDRISTAAVETFGTELPEKTKRQLMEHMSGVDPMQHFLKGTEGLVGGSVDKAFWDELVLNDPLAAELDAM